MQRKLKVHNATNIEIIKIDAPAGDYVVQITHKRSIRIRYSLLVNGATPKTASSRNVVIGIVEHIS
jgi:hypothetical protein